MAELPSGFWSGWVLVLTVVSLAGLLWLVLSVYFTKSASHDTGAEPVWDESLTEGSNSPPLWWFWMLLAAMVFSLIYLMLYPGLGSYPGLLNWSQGSRLASSYNSFTDTFEQQRAAISEASITELQNDSELMDLAERIFARECSACHGSDGRGQASLFPNLHDVDWQWGGTPEQIQTSIRQGRNANMIAWGSILDDSATADVADYVRTLSASTQTNTDAHPGATTYQQYCMACHGSDGTGNPLLGAPNLTDNIWLYGDSESAVITSIASGRQGMMPAFADRLDDAQINLLTAFLAR